MRDFFDLASNAAHSALLSKDAHWLLLGGRLLAASLALYGYKNNPPKYDTEPSSVFEYHKRTMLTIGYDSVIIPLINVLINKGVIYSALGVENLTKDTSSLGPVTFMRVHLLLHTTNFILQTINNKDISSKSVVRFILNIGLVGFNGIAEYSYYSSNNSAYAIFHTALCGGQIILNSIQSFNESDNQPLAQHIIGKYAVCAATDLCFMYFRLNQDELLNNIGRAIIINTICEYKLHEKFADAVVSAKDQAATDLGF